MCGRLVESFAEVCEKYCLKVNAGKCKVVVVERDQRQGVMCNGVVRVEKWLRNLR